MISNGKSGDSSTQETEYKSDQFIELADQFSELESVESSAPLRGKNASIAGHFMAARCTLKVVVNIRLRTIPSAALQLFFARRHTLHVSV